MTRQSRLRLLRATKCELLSIAYPGMHSNIGVYDRNEMPEGGERRVNQESITWPTLPFSCPFRATKGSNSVQPHAKRKLWKSLRKRRKLDYVRGLATSCKS